jgi:aspartate aminotransferase
VSYPEIARMVYGVPVFVTPEDGSLHPRIEDIARAVSPSTKVVIVNSPNNPSGLVFREDFIKEIVEFCERKQIYLMMDDIYHKLVFDDKKAASCYGFTQLDAEESRLITVNGVSKLYGMTGFLIGWAIAPRRLVRVMTNIQAQTTSCASVILQAAAEGALSGLQSIVENLRQTMENNRNIIMQELKSFNEVKTVQPDGTFYCFPDFRAYETDSVKLSEFLLEKARVVTVPGKEFGMEGRLRLSFAGSVNDLVEGIARMRWALDASYPDEIYIGDRKMVRNWL